MHYEEIKLTSGAVILAGLLLAATDTQAENILETPRLWLESGKTASKYPNISLNQACSKTTTSARQPITNHGNSDHQG